MRHFHIIQTKRKLLITITNLWVGQAFFGKELNVLRFQYIKNVKRFWRWDFSITILNFRFDVYIRGKK